MCVGAHTSPPPPRHGAPLSLLLCALALEVTSFGVRQAGTQQERLSLSLSELLNFWGEEEREEEDEKQACDVERRAAPLRIPGIII